MTKKKIAALPRINGRVAQDILDPDPMHSLRDKNGIAVDLVLDSGAYSAKTQGVTIDIDEYIAYIKYNQESLYAYAALDVIGDAKASYANLKYMESKGLSPLPVFHYKESYQYLEEYVAEYDYIALGGMVGEINSLQSWLDHVWWEYLTDDKGFATTKVHGFGLSSVPSLLRYPWESADSTSWVLCGSFGKILVPKIKGGEWDFLQIPNRVLVSVRDTERTQDPDHFDNILPAIQDLILGYIDELGTDIEALKTDYRCRDAVNIHWFYQMELAINKHPRRFIPRAQGFFR